jgi:hypothetical protein
MNGSPPEPGPMSRVISEEDAFRQMSAIDQLRAPSPPVGAEQAAANRQQNLRDLMSIIPGPGNVISAEDAITQGGEAAGAFGQGQYGRAAMHGGMSALSAFGAVTGLPTGRMAGNAARDAGRTLNAFPAGSAAPTQAGDIYESIAKNNQIGDYRLQGPAADDTYQILRGDGRAVGDINVGQMDDGSVLLGPRIGAEFQRQGIGTQIYKHIQGLAKESGLQLKPSDVLTPAGAALWKSVSR